MTLGFLVLSILSSSPALAATPRTPAGKCERLLSDSGLRFDSIKKIVTFGSSIRLDKLPAAELKNLCLELAARSVLVETPSGARGFIRSAFMLKDGRWFLQFKSMKHKAGAESTEFLFRKDSPRTTTLRILATPGHIPDRNVAIRKASLSEDLKATGLKPRDQGFLLEHAKAVLGFSDFLQDERFRTAGDKVMLLGNDTHLYRSLAAVRNYEVFETIYRTYYENGLLSDTGEPWDVDTGPEKSVTDRFMKQVAESYDIVFFLPDDFSKQADLYGKSHGGYTFEEWRWLLAHPKVMERVTFVVGAEKSLVMNGYDVTATDSDRSTPPVRKEYLRILQDPSPFLLW